nr:MAG TPA: hypothetical protein [Caudoviricetes sp.]
MSRSAKQDLPSVRLLSVVFLSANEFWKSENSREKVHTRCALGFMSVLYNSYESCKSPRQIERENEMIVISHRFFVVMGSAFPLL